MLQIAIPVEIEEVDGIDEDHFEYNSLGVPIYESRKGWGKLFRYICECCGEIIIPDRTDPLSPKEYLTILEQKGMLIED